MYVMSMRGFDRVFFYHAFFFFFFFGFGVWVWGVLDFLYFYDVIIVGD
jgi:hypothetical protein